MQELLPNELEALTRRPSLDVTLERIRDRKAIRSREVPVEKILESRDLDRR